MPDIEYTPRASQLLNRAINTCKSYRHEFVTPEHFLLVLLDDEVFCGALFPYFSAEKLEEKQKKHQS